jgi:ribosomal-protein-alanine N-acetyltransferase
MEFFRATLDRTEAEAMLSKIEERMHQQGFGFLGYRTKEDFIGFIGLNVPGYPLPFNIFKSDSARGLDRKSQQG